ncbi:hypothetical protein ACE6H2_014757 [Prunus campanulata]
MVPRFNELPRPPDQVKQVQTGWEKPRRGFVKANCDGAWVEHTGIGGIGWVIRDFVGWMMQAGGQGDMRYGSAFVAEVDAIRAVLSACQQGGFARVMVESDSLIAIQMVNRERLVDAEVDKVIFIHAPRSCNNAAHEVASFVRRIGGTHLWDFVPPEWLFNTLAIDAKVSVRL